MAITGSKSGSFTNTVNCGGLSGSTTLTVSGSNNPTVGVTAPAGLTGSQSVINTQLTCILVVNDPTNSVAAAQKVSVFWNVAGVLNACYDAAVASVSYNTPSTGLTQVTLTQSGGTGQPTGALYYASSGSAPTLLPVNGTAITLAIGQDITDGVSIPGGTGANIQQLMATSTQPGLFNWLTASGGTQERLSAILAAGAFDTWPTASSQLGSLPSGSAGLAWTSAQTVTDIRCYNLGSTIANIGVSSSPATMQASVILA
jgi:hypothetical protein